MGAPGAKTRRLVTIVAALVLGAMVVAGGSLAATSLLTGAPEGSPTSAATPRATPSATATPSPAPSATPSPTPTHRPASCELVNAHLSVPAVGEFTGVEADLTAFTAQDLAELGKVEPRTKESVVWNKSIYERFGVSHNITSCPSSSAQYCVHIAAHSWKDESAPFNPMRYMPVGAKAVLTNDGERLTYVKTEGEFEVRKDQQETDPILNDWSKPMPGCLLLITCLSEGERDGNGHTLSLRVTRLWLESVEQVP